MKAFLTDAASRFAGFVSAWFTEPLFAADTEWLVEL